MANLKRRVEIMNNKIQRLAARFKQGAPATVQNQGFTELRFIRDAYNGSTVYLRGSGRAFSLRGFDPKVWGKVKATMGWDMRRGHAKTTGLGSAVGNPSTLRRTTNGFAYDLTVVNARLKNYWETFSITKTRDSLMQFKAGVNDRMRDVLRKQIEILVKEEFGSAAVVLSDGNGVVVQISMKEGLLR